MTAHRSVATALAWRTPLALGTVVAVVTALDVWWRTLETRPPHWDMGHHLANSIAYLDGFSFSNPLPFFDAYNYYPPLVYWITDAFYAAIGSEAMWVAVLSNVVWLAILVFATFALGKRLWSPRIGWLSVAFVLAAPIIVSSQKDYMLDVPVTATVALALYLLIRCRGFSNRRDSLLLGLACGFGLLVKWTFPLVLALPLLHASAAALSDARLRRRFDPLLNLAGAGVLTFAVAGTWYVHNLRQVLGSLAYDGGKQGAVEGDPPLKSAASATWYLWNLVNTQLYLVPTLLAVVALAFCLLKRGFAARNAYPILMVVGTFVIFTLVRNKDPRDTIPMLPALAVVATSWVDYLAARVRTWVAAAFVAYAAAAFLAISFGTSVLPKNLTVGLPSTSFAPASLTVFAQHGYITGPPTSEQWHQEDLFTTMAAFPKAERTFAYRGPSTIWFNEHGLSYYSWRYRAQWVSVKRAQFLIERGARPATEPGYKQLRSWRLPDGGSLGLFERL